MPPPADEHPAIAGRQWRVRGLVQGVGFRPNVWRIATELGVSGDVANDGAGVLVRGWGTPGQLDALADRLTREVPPLARIDSIETMAANEPAPSSGFLIAASTTGAVSTGIVPDAATCPACLAEMRDPADRRHRYPFSNCTHCGPRLSIIEAIPYDRAVTSMAAFAMCQRCAAEYRDPADRRFHAQPIACPDCGPRLWLEDADGATVAERDDAVRAAIDAIRQGRILAIKGLGGFHLACDATNAAAVSRLRQRKARYAKPFALMARDLDMIGRYAQLGEPERALLASSAAPVVIFRARAATSAIADGVAPGQTGLGFMLPYTPLHHLLMDALAAPIVLTSGNRSDEPQAIANDEARQRLSNIADLWLMHDRDIVNRLDDSVVKFVADAPRMMRRARGYAPSPLRLAETFVTCPPVLALGAELKSTFCLLRGADAVVSQHLGDLENAATFADYERSLALYRSLYRFAPEAIAVDLHPDYFSTKLGDRLHREHGIPLVPVQHHHAHIASVLAEHGHDPRRKPVLGIVLDGLGMGENGELWGGEFLLADMRSSKRVASIDALPLLGGAAAMREPWRNAFVHLDTAMGWEAAAARLAGTPLARLLAEKPLPTLRAMAARGINAPLASSAGRLFDAVAAVLGISCDRVSYEGEAAIALEALAEAAADHHDPRYPVTILAGPDIPRISWRSLWQALVEDLCAGTDRATIAARFHSSLVAGLANLARALCQEHGLDTIVLGGGVFQNALLLRGMLELGANAGFAVLAPARLPANDGGISLGQAVVAAARLSRS